MVRPWACPALQVALLWSWLGLLFIQPLQGASAAWWKGNLHTHTLWSDGDDFPEMVADWYKSRGYHFLALSDHNQMQAGDKWVNQARLAEKELTVERYRSRFGAAWVTERTVADQGLVRLKTLAEFAPLLEESGRFLLIPATEITAQYKVWPVHVNASNIKAPFIVPVGNSVLEVMQACVDSVLRQRATTGQPMIPHVNHPNFGWAITGEDLAQVRGEKFFEVYNGHPEVHNLGDGTRLGTEAIWDVVLALRLSKTKLGPIYGLAVDDSHRYHTYGPRESNPGRGWVMVRASQLKANDLIQAMERGDFYASTGVRLLDVKRERKRLSVTVDPEQGVTYSIRFIGTPKRFLPQGEPIIAKDGRPYPTTRRYGSEVGMILKQVEGVAASYEFDGTELYVRATVISSKAKADSLSLEEKETAWVQPLVALP